MKKVMDDAFVEYITDTVMEMQIQESSALPTLRKQLEELRRLIDSFVSSVTIFDDRIVITFNHKEGTTTVPFSKLDSSDLSSVGGPLKPRGPLLSWL